MFVCFVQLCVEDMSTVKQEPFCPLASLTFTQILLTARGPLRCLMGKVQTTRQNKLLGFLVLKISC